MKYFIDTEFIEGFHKPLFGKRRHFIDLISIGIVAEDGRTYEAISSEYSYHDANDWVKTNVIIPMYIKTVHGDRRNHIDADNFQKVFGLPNKRIANEIAEFFGCYKDNSGLYWRAPSDIEVYAYYADYDWVVFCSLFGRMIDLPKGFPMYCRDLKQMLDEKMQLKREGGRDRNRKPLKDYLKAIKKSPDYPKQSNEHNALDDAKWNKQLHEFIQTI